MEENGKQRKGGRRRARKKMNIPQIYRETKSQTKKRRTGNKQQHSTTTRTRRERRNRNNVIGLRSNNRSTGNQFQKILGGQPVCDTSKWKRPVKYNTTRNGT